MLNQMMPIFVSLKENVHTFIFPCDETARQN